MGIELEISLLERFERSLGTAAPPLVDFLRPGLDPGTIDQLAGGLPGFLPREAYRFWGWRNGVDVQAALAAHSSFPMTLGAGEFKLGSLEDCIALYLDGRELAETVSGMEPDEIAPPDWFPIELSGRVSLRLTSESETSSEVISSDGYSPAVLGDTMATSLGEVILWWTESLENGGLKWSADSSWEVDSSRIRPELRTWGLT